MSKLGIIVASTRPGRVGLPVAKWFEGEARTHGGFDEVDLIDLAEVALPFMNEPNHPRFGRYTHQHTRDWSARIAGVDAVVFVMPEYNHGYNAELKNAIDYLHNEWLYKPVGFVSYGGVAAGTRALQAIKPVVIAVKLTPVTEAVNIPFVQQFLDEESQVQPNETMVAAAKAMMDELVRVEETLRPLRPALAESSQGV
ncbi:NAD(P)H-dependent FMN reductase [Actinacidiphila yanglinensis]|uniref:NAD(P)H-dependent FMN reductase n=1 Tax=Actinacidiphila yanglinensis TaxID=310779 RepID=A0A1H6DAY7_9ACTN|nr:NAD(P)H-dependent oxidoreductase [Actinacidiphila yanglinensis]SEG82352.1 NAD(P)H-dependent FMN reductase [Actinacidiphila yanglinensis]